MAVTSLSFQYPDDTSVSKLSWYIASSSADSVKDRARTIAGCMSPGPDAFVASNLCKNLRTISVQKTTEGIQSRSAGVGNTLSEMGLPFSPCTLSKWLANTMAFSRPDVALLPIPSRTHPTTSWSALSDKTYLCNAFGFFWLLEQYLVHILI